MTFEELLKSCATGELPQVEISAPVKFAASTIGQVTTIKKNRNHSGIAVQFEGLDYDTWFHNDPTGTDKRSRYMHELKFANPK